MSRVPASTRITIVLLGVLFAIAWFIGVLQIMTESEFLSDLLLLMGGFGVGLGVGAILHYLEGGWPS